MGETPKILLKQVPFFSGIPIKLFDTLNRKKIDIVPENGKYIKLYTCGPTVYDYAHIGNFRTYVFEDILKRTLKFFDMEVSHIMNITDLDDKTIDGSEKEGIALEDLVRLSIDDLLSKPAEDCQQAIEYLLKKNKNLYERLF